MSVNQIKYMLSKLWQRRYYLEKQIEQIGEMIPACLILRYRARGTKDFQSRRKKAVPGGKSYAYLTYLKDGITRHRYIRKDRIDEIVKLTGNYRAYCEKIARIRSINKRIVELLEKMSEIKMKGVEGYVKKKGIKKAKLGKKKYNKERKRKD